MARIGRNDRCPCGRGKKYKQCCLAKDEAAERAARVQPTTVAAARTAEAHHHPYFCNECDAEVDEAANIVIALIDVGKLDDAERAAQTLVERWPDIYDGYDCLGVVCHARGDKHQAEYWRKVIGFARSEPSLDDPGGSAPNPRDI